MSTMRRLMLLRHAKAERQAPGQADRSRVLIERGHGQAADIGAFLLRHALAPDRVVVSPAERTRQTWTTTGAAFDTPPPALEDERLYNASARTILDIARESPDASRAVMLVGHNPGMHEAAIELVATGDIEARQRLNEKLPTAGLVVIDFKLTQWSALHRQGGRLVHFVTPRQLTPNSD